MNRSERRKGLKSINTPQKFTDAVSLALKKQREDMLNDFVKQKKELTMYYTSGLPIQWIIFIGVALLSWLVQANLKRKFEKYSRISLGNGMTGRDVALKMLHDNGIYDVKVIIRVCFNIQFRVIE